MSRHAVSFFDSQFQNQVRQGEYALNPFEQQSLPYLQGDVLDLGCGLGNLALAAARLGCTVTALDGSPTAIARIREAASAEDLPMTVQVADLNRHVIEREHDVIVCIGLLMFFPETTARAILADILSHVRPGGLVILNVLTEGTTFMGMFETGHYYLFPQGAMKAELAGWTILVDAHDAYPAPGDTLKLFDTVIARKPV